VYKRFTAIIPAVPAVDRHWHRGYPEDSPWSGQDRVQVIAPMDDMDFVDGMDEMDLIRQ